ncbi:head vertex assembly chaperone [Acinetobacter phage 133]|uniref:Gp40 head vertex assembly chaperone n=1 Tax=Acinetobacter phage 133 TaxID=2919552 RepID=Q6J2M5_9CAUD|nr:head vertex assembly chaperone [Acinetobacter phage 133]AAT38508.1 gp40 head vertex assembly chaperone [Acinetobacter phage 133]
MTVLQEMTILLDGQEHLVYITELEMTDKGLKYAFGTASEGYEDVLAPHIEKCLQIQVDEQIKIYQEVSLWSMIKKFLLMLWSKK